MPDLDGIEAALQIHQHRPVPIILVSAYHDAQLVQRAEADHILCYLVKPIKQADLEPSIALAVRRFQEFQALQKETADLREVLANRSSSSGRRGS
jgi:response regulator NasT